MQHYPTPGAPTPWVLGARAPMRNKQWVPSTPENRHQESSLYSYGVHQNVKLVSRLYRQLMMPKTLLCGCFGQQDGVVVYLR
ncbi:hypothetical protein MTP99_004647 [Tenebrio molitor]|nr:hypothetical protein MTP99_004647 [Tenebrio molitor]